MHMDHHLKPKAQVDPSVAAAEKRPSSFYDLNITEPSWGDLKTSSSFYGVHQALNGVTRVESLVLGHHHGLML